MSQLIDYRIKKYSDASDSQNFLTRLVVEQNAPEENDIPEVSAPATSKFADFMFFSVLPVSLLAMGVGVILNRVFG